MLRWAAHGAGVAIDVLLVVGGAVVLGALLIALNLVTLAAFAAARRRGAIAPQQFVRGYSSGSAETFAALQSTVRTLGYRASSVDAVQRTIVFNTGMSWKTWAGQDFTAVVHDQGETSELSLVGATAQRGLGALQSVSWGETAQVGKRVFEQTAKELASQGPAGDAGQRRGLPA